MEGCYLWRAAICRGLLFVEGCYLWMAAICGGLICGFQFSMEDETECNIQGQFDLI